MAMRNNRQTNDPRARKSNGAQGQQPRRPAPQQPARRSVSEREPASPGSIMWRLALILCTGMVIVALLFASVNGGSKYVGLPEEDTSATPTPPVATIDPALNVTGSDQTPIPPSASPETGDTGTEETQPVTP